MLFYNQYNVFFAVNTGEQLKEIKKLCCTIFGGYSLQDMQGGWTSPSGEIVEEESKFLQVDAVPYHCVAMCDVVPESGNRARHGDETVAARCT